MIGRFLAILVGLGGLLAGSQAPGFTLQYMQNLSGRVDELAVIVAEYDRIVAELGVTREGYIGDLRAADRESTEKTAEVIEDTFARYTDLSEHLGALRAANDFARPLILARNLKRDIAESVMEEFKPAIPATADGFAYGGGGFAFGWGVSSFLFGLLGAMTGGRR